MLFLHLVQALFLAKCVNKMRLGKWNWRIHWSAIFQEGRDSSFLCLACRKRSGKERNHNYALLFPVVMYTQVSVSFHIVYRESHTLSDVLAGFRTTLECFHCLVNFHHHRGFLDGLEINISFICHQCGQFLHLKLMGDHC